MQIAEMIICYILLLFLLVLNIDIKILHFSNCSKDNGYWTLYIMTSEDNVWISKTFQLFVLNGKKIPRLCI